MRTVLTNPMEVCTQKHAQTCICVRSCILTPQHGVLCLCLFVCMSLEHER